MSLTSYPGIESSPAFSPDGKQVAFSWNGDSGDNEDIYVVMVGSDSPLPITRDPARDVSPAWKPDGSLIAFARVESGRASIYQVSPIGNSERKIADFAVIQPQNEPIESRDPRLSWSPDGHWLAVSRVTSGTESGIFLLAEDGTRSVLLPAKAGDDYGMAAFSPKGDALASVNSGFIEVLGIAGSRPPTVISARRLVTPFLRSVSGLAWTVDGKALLFGRSEYPAPDPPHLWQVSAVGDAEPKRIELAGVAAFPAVSVSGSRLAFVRRGMNEDLFKLQEGRDPETILVSTSNEQDASYSNDGTRIAFASDRGGEGNEIWVAQADGFSRRSVTRGAHKPEGSPRWSPRDDRLVFDGLGEDDLRHIFVVDSAGGPIRAIGVKSGANDQIPSWSRDGRWIYFGSNRTGRYEVWRVLAVGGDAQQVTTNGGAVPFESVDGTTLYYSRQIDGVRALFAMPVTGGAEEPLGITVTFWNYVPAKRGLYYMPLRQGTRAPFTFEVRFFDLFTRQNHLVYSVRLADASPGLSVMPDGKTVLIDGTAQITQDLMRIENFR